MGYKGNIELPFEVKTPFVSIPPMDGRPAMKKGLMIALALAVMFVVSAGCTGSGKEGFIKCPKCGTYFKTQEGADWFNNMGRMQP